MNMRQKIFIFLTILIILILIISTFSILPKQNTDEDKIKIAASFYPLAFFAEKIGGEKVTVKQLIPDNMEVHNWQPSFSDILTLEDADILLYNGASLDHWFEEDILNVINPTNKLIVKTTDGLQLLETKTENNAVENNHSEPYDPHTWISPFLAQQQAEKIYTALIQKDPNNTQYYSSRWLELKTNLEELDADYFNYLLNKTKNEIFVAHSAFGYLAERYGFIQFGVIGISADEQPSASTYANLVEMMIDQEIFVVFVDPIYPNESAQTLGNELKRLTGHDVIILKLYFMLGEMDGLDYLEQQEKNLENLIIGLDAK
ncbi:MAG: zinc ABC transporter substrate-binding protein [Candidatus Bathyarchaeota archaeon]